MIQIVITICNTNFNKSQEQEDETFIKMFYPMRVLMCTELHGLQKQCADLDQKIAKSLRCNSEA